MSIEISQEQLSSIEQVEKTDAGIIDFLKKNLSLVSEEVQETTLKPAKTALMKEVQESKKTEEQVQEIPSSLDTERGIIYEFSENDYEELNKLLSNVQYINTVRSFQGIENPLKRIPIIQDIQTELKNRYRTYKFDYDNLNNLKNKTTDEEQKIKELQKALLTFNQTYSKLENLRKREIQNISNNTLSEILISRDGKINSSGENHIDGINNTGNENLFIDNFDISTHNKILKLGSEEQKTYEENMQKFNEKSKQLLGNGLFQITIDYINNECQKNQNECVFLKEKIDKNNRIYQQQGLTQVNSYGTGNLIDTPEIMIKGKRVQEFNGIKKELQGIYDFFYNVQKNNIQNSFPSMELFASLVIDGNLYDQQIYDTKEIILKKGEPKIYELFKTVVNLKLEREFYQRFTLNKLQKKGIKL